MSVPRGFKKYGSLDKYDAFIPVKNQFIHDDYYVSAWKYNFHTSTAYVFRTKNQGNLHMGVQKCQNKISPKGLKVDKLYIGKSDE